VHIVCFSNLRRDTSFPECYKNEKLDISDWMVADAALSALSTEHNFPDENNE
jgi:hypothetical protein